MRIVFIGTPNFAVPSLATLCKSDARVSLVVTKPDARSGRGRKRTRSAVKKFALEKGLMLYQPRRFSSDPTAELLKRLRPDAGVIVAYGEVLAPWLIDMFPQGLFNVHASLLPKYRGAAPVNHALLNGEEETGVTVQRVVPEIDAGPILAQKKVIIEPDENAGRLHDRLSVLGARCLGEVFGRLARGEEIAENRQNDTEATRAPKLRKEDGRIDWTSPASAVKNHIRGMTPWPGAFCTYRGKEREEKIKITEARHAGPVNEAPPGTIVEITEKEEMVVAAEDGNGLVIKTLKPAGGRTMKSGDFIHGRHVTVGERFE